MRRVKIKKSNAKLGKFLLQRPFIYSSDMVAVLRRKDAERQVERL